MMGFFEKLKSLGNAVKLRATGAMSGHVLTVEPGDDSEEKKSKFAELFALLGGGVAAGAVLVFRSIVMGSSSQLLGVTSAMPMRQAGAGIALGGFCLQASKKTPNHDEKFATSDAEEVPQDRINTFLTASKECLDPVIEDYYFVEKLGQGAFRHQFNQAGIWIITDNIGFARVRDLIFPEYLLFTSGPMELLFWLREALKKAGEDLTSMRFNRELVSVLHLNHRVGFITGDQYKGWQYKFGFTVSLG